MTTVGSLFTGAGLLDIGLHQAGFQHEWMCEADPWRRALLHKRFPRVPVHADVRAVGALTARRVDVIAGGFPCRGASTAGKRGGLTNPETALWHEMRRCVGELRPRFVLIENVASILSMEAGPGEPPGSLWGTVLAGLVSLRYDVRWDCVPAAATGAPHLRDRVFAIAADADGDAGEREQLGGPDRVPRRPDCSGHREAAPDPGGVRLAQQPQQDRERRAGLDRPRRHDSQRRGTRVEWGEYLPAIRRWEAVHGPAPDPLTRLRGLDDGDPALQRVRRGVDRSRLSALGDGVHVHAARLVGGVLMGLCQDPDDFNQEPA